MLVFIKMKVHCRKNECVFKISCKTCSGKSTYEQYQVHVIPRGHMKLFDSAKINWLRKYYLYPCVFEFCFQDKYLLTKKETMRKFTYVFASYHSYDN